MKYIDTKVYTWLNAQGIKVTKKTTIEDAWNKLRANGIWDGEILIGLKETTINALKNDELYSTITIPNSPKILDKIGDPKMDVLTHLLFKQVMVKPKKTKKITTQKKTTRKKTTQKK